MSKSLGLLLSMLTVSMLLASRAQAHDPSHPYPPSPPPSYIVQPLPAAPSYVVQQPPLHYHHERGSAFGSAYRGLVAGALSGLGVGYLVARDHGHGLRDEGWRSLLFGSSVGALSGAGLGLTLHLLQPPLGHYVSRDMLYGALFGAFAGATAGGLSALLGQSGERILFGSAIGAAAGAGLGVLTGLFQARRADRSLAHAAPRRTLGFAPTPGGRGISASLHGRF